MYKQKICSKDDIVKHFHDGMRIMVGGFANTGCPEKLVDLIVEKGFKNLEVISNDAGDPGLTIGKIFDNHLVIKGYHSHLGMNPPVSDMIRDGILDVQLFPQGTLAEKIRAGGSGLGGVLVKTGLGTIAEEGRKVVEIDGERYIFEQPFRAEIALIRAHKADKFGNLIYKGAGRNFNPVMAMAADLVIVQADEIVEVGALDPENIVTPGVYVDMILSNEE